jgi:hypothetical protein
VVLPDSHRVSRVPWYSGSVSEGEKFRLQDCYLLWLSIPGTIHLFFTFLTPCETPYNPKSQWLLVWAVSVSLAATQEIAVAFSSSGYLDVSVPLVAPTCPMCSGKWYSFFERVGYPIRRSPDQRLLTATRSISVFVPSFIGS